MTALENYGCTWPIQTLKPEEFKCQMEKFDDTKKKLMAESYTGNVYGFQTSTNLNKLNKFLMNS